MSQTTRTEVLTKLRRRYEQAGAAHKRKLLDQAQELLGYHRKAAIRALRAPARVQGPRIITGRPVEYEPSLLVPWLRPIWHATDYACGQRLVAMLPEWIPAYEQHERRMPEEVREKLLLASGRTLDRLLEPWRGQGRSVADAAGQLVASFCDATRIVSHFSRNSRSVATGLRKTPPVGVIGDPAGRDGRFGLTERQFWPIRTGAIPFHPL